MANTPKIYRDLIVWQRAMQLVTEIYQTSKTWPREETYGLTSQIRRCAVSIPSNIAEGFARRSQGDYLRFLNIAMGSLFELQTQLEVAKNIGFIDALKFTEPCWPS
jgi:four helix bundle protein